MLTGATGAGGEIGHIHVNDAETDTCGCGNHGCLEQYTSATGVTRLANKKLKESDKDSVLRREEVSAKTVFDAVKAGDELAKEVDFFSIGTNDLTQYTLAIDRQNAKLDQFYDSHHPAVLKMIQMVIDSAHKAGIWAGICGELGADLTLTETFVKMGIDELSVSPAMVLPVRDKILNA